MARLGILLLPCVFVASVLWPLSSAYTDTEARERVAKLEAKVDILTNEVLRLRDHVDDLRNCEGGNRNSHDRNDGGADEGGDDNSSEGGSSSEENSLVLLEVRREALLPSGYRLTVQFWTNVPDRELTVVWLSNPNMFSASFDILHGVLLTNISDEDPGLREAYVDLSRPHRSVNAWLLTYDVGFSLELNGTFGGPEVERDFRNQRIDFKPSHEIVYTRGSNASFTMKMNKDMDKPSFQTTYVTLKTQTLSTVHSSNGFLNMSAPHQYFDSKEFTVTLNTSEKTTSGVINVYERLDYDNRVIMDVTITRRLYFRPLDQDGPFPAGFLQFQEPMRHIGTSEACDLNNPKGNCFFFCNVYGDNIASFTNTFVRPDGRREDLSGTDQCIEFRSRHFAYSLIQLNTEKYGLGSGRLVCAATNKQGVFVEQAFHVDFYRKTEVLKNETHQRFLNDSRVELVCAAEGNPLPEITFQVILNVNIGSEILQPDVVWVGDKVVASVTLTSTPFSARCILGQNVTGNTESKSYYDYPIHPAYAEELLFDNFTLYDDYLYEYN